MTKEQRFDYAFTHNERGLLMRACEIHICAICSRYSLHCSGNVTGCLCKCAPDKPMRGEAGK